MALTSAQAIRNFGSNPKGRRLGASLLTASPPICPRTSIESRAMNNPAGEISCRSLSKAFGPTVALDSVDVDFHAGEVHAVVGENGSGKSTLFKILAGVYEPDHGRIWTNGKEVPLPIRPRNLDDYGFAFVHQDLGLAEGMSVLDNARVGLYVTRRAWRISWRHEREALANQLAEFNIPIDPDTLIEELPQAVRTLVAIVRALGRQRHGSGSLLVLDEPTANLPAPDRERLYTAMRSVAASGVAVVFSTHHMDEALALGDRITVLRDGQVAGCFMSTNVTESDLIRAVLGRDLGAYYPDISQDRVGKVVLCARGLGDGYLRDFAVTLHAGEILGLTGLIGAGQDNIPYLLFGVRPWKVGSVVIGGTEFARLEPAIALGHGLGLLPANRHRHSGLQGSTLRENVTMPYLKDFLSKGRLALRRERDHVGRILRRYNVRPAADPDLLLGKLSGGNQQKTLLAKWLNTPGIQTLILHEPTQGVDIGAKKELFRTIRQASEAGLAILLVTAEYEELAHLADRVIVMRRGRVEHELVGDAVTEANILRYCHAVPV